MSQHIHLWSIYWRMHLCNIQVHFLYRFHTQSQAGHTRTAQSSYRNWSELIRRPIQSLPISVTCTITQFTFYIVACATTYNTSTIAELSTKTMDIKTSTNINYGSGTSEYNKPMTPHMLSGLGDRQQSREWRADVMVAILKVWRQSINQSISIRTFV